MLAQWHATAPRPLRTTRQNTQEHGLCRSVCLALSFSVSHSGGDDETENELTLDMRAAEKTPPVMKIANPFLDALYQTGYR